MAAGDSIYRLFPFGALNNIRSALQRTPSAYQISGLNATRRTVAGPFAPGRLNPNGPYMGQVIWSYGPEQGLPPGHIYDFLEGQDSSLIRMPWIVVRIEELMSNIPNPAKYDPNGTPRQQYLYWKAVKAHFEVGICFPEIESTNYPKPNPTDRVLVSYTNVKTFDGARYKVISGEPGQGLTGNYGEGQAGRRLQMVLDPNGNWILLERPGASPPTSSETLSAYLQRQGIPPRMADNIEDDANDPPRGQWQNIVPAASILMGLETRTGFRLKVFSSYRRSNSVESGRSKHMDFHALDFRAYREGTDEQVSEEEWVYIQRVCINLWRTQGRELRFGLGMYIKEWGNERQIHVDGDGYRRWAHGPDAEDHPVSGAGTGGMSLKKYYREFGRGHSESRVMSLNPDYDDFGKLLTDTFWRLVEDGVPTEVDFRRIFSGDPGQQETRPIPNLSNLYLF